MIASLLTLTRADLVALRVTDPYSIHRVVYDLFEDVRTADEKCSSIPSGILYVDKGGDFNSRQILILSSRPPRECKHGKIQSKTIASDFLEKNTYRFEIVLNPTKRDNKTRKILPIRGRQAITEWFTEKSQESWGFTVDNESFQVHQTGVQSFTKSDKKIEHGSAKITGVLAVTDRLKFIKTFQNGIGRGKAFGFGFLQIAPF